MEYTILSRRWCVGVTMAVFAAAGAGCGGSPTAPTSSSVSIAGSTALTELSPATQLTLDITLTSGTPQLVTSAATWQSSDTTIASVSAGYVQAVGPGTATITATYQGHTSNVSITVGQDADCTTYDPSSLKVLPSGGTPPFWALTVPFGSSLELLFSVDNAPDGDKLLALGQRYQQSCLIGQGNAFSNRVEYTMNYWRTPTGAQTMISPEDCDSYNAASLQEVNEGGNGWALMAGATRLAILPSQLDAGLALAVATQYSNKCYIGRGNTEANPYDFMVSYWK